MVKSEADKYSFRSTRLFWFLLILGILTVGMLGIPSIYYIQQINLESELEILEADPLDTSNTGLYDRINLIVDVPSEGVQLLDLVIEIRGNRYIWQYTTNTSLLPGGTQDLTVKAADRNNEVPSNTLLGVALIYNKLGSEDIKYAIITLDLEFRQPDIGIVFGIYSNLLAPEGWISKEYQEEITLGVISAINQLKQNYSVEILILNDESLVNFMRVNAGTDNWLIFPNDVLPERIYPQRYVRGGPLAEYLDLGGNVAFFGGKPLFFSFDENFELQEENRAANLLFNVRSGGDRFFENADAVFSPTELGQTVMNRNSTDIYYSFSPLSDKVETTYGLDVDKFGQSYNNRYLDPAKVTLESTSEVLFAHMRRINQADVADRVVADITNILKYLIVDTLDAQINFEETSQYDLDKDGSAETLRFELDNPYPYYRITKASLIDNGTTVPLDFDVQNIYSEFGEQEILEVVYPAGFVDTRDYRLTLSIDHNYDYETDLTVTRQFRFSEDIITDPPSYVYYDLAMINKNTFNSSVISTLDKSPISGSGFRYLIENQVSDNITLIGNEYPWVDSLDLANWIQSGGQLTTYGNIYGTLFVDELNIISRGTSSDIASIFLLTEDAVKLGYFEFNVINPQYLPSTKFSGHQGISALNARSIPSLELLPISSQDDYIGSFHYRNLGLYSHYPLSSLTIDMDAYNPWTNQSLFLDTVNITQTVNYDIDNTQDLIILDLEVISTFKTISLIDDIQVSSVGASVDKQTLLPGINYVKVMLTNTSISISDTLSIEITVSSETTSIQVNPSNHSIDFLTYFDNELPFLTQSRANLLRELPGNTITITTPFFMEIIENNITTTIVNMNEILPYNISIENNSFVNWIQLGGNFVHFGAEFGKYFYVDNTLNVLSTEEYQLVFDVGIYRYIPGSVVNSTFFEQSWNVDYVINATSLIVAEYSFQIFAGIQIRSDFVQITGNGQGIKLGNGTLTISSVSDLAVLIPNLEFIMEVIF